MADKTGDDTVDNEPIFLKNQEKKVFDLSVTVPEVIPEKDYYFSLLAQSQAPPTNEGSITARTQLAVSSSILISVTSDGSLDMKPKVIAFYGAAKNSLNIFGRRLSIVQSGEKVPLVLQLSNQGRHMIQAQGTITANGMGPKKSLNLIPQLILASSQSIVYAKGDTSNIAYSTYLPGLFFGPYTVNAIVNFGPSSPIIYAKTNLFVIPSLRMTGLLILLIVLAVFFIRRYRDR